MRVPVGDRRRAGVLAIGALLLGVASPATAQLTLLDGDGPTLLLSGYVRAFTGVHDTGYDPPDLPGLPTAARQSGFHGQVIRLKWQLEGGGWRLDAHDRVQARLTSAASEAPVLGFGVSTVPDRLVDLETDLVDRPGLRVWHDLDRLSLSVFTDAADITLGRQAITWGVSTLFPVADLWARFSPFELDTEEKPGVDALRVLFYPAAGLEMDAVVADRGRLEDLSVGLRGTYGMARLDVWAGAGKFWRQALAMGGVTILFDETRIRAEGAVPWDLEERGLLDPRATLGVDWIRGTLAVSGEYHFNGIGAGELAEYTAVLNDPRFARGETYYLGRHYLGGLLSWSPDEENRLSLSLNALANIHDASMAVTPVVGYDIGQASRVALGALLSLGDTPVFTMLPPTLGSEFGTYGSLVFTQLSIYF